ncbi:cyanobactin maturation protease PatG family protein [Nocardia brasiliensis]
MNRPEEQVVHMTPDDSPVDTTPTAAQSDCGCGTRSSSAALAKKRNSAPSMVYAIGTIEPRFPSLAIEKEFAQATGRAETANLTDREALYTVLADPNNRYLSRQLCYLLSIQGLETYLIRPGDPVAFPALIEALQSGQSTDRHVVIGWRGPLSTSDMCNGMTLPVVYFDQIYSFATQDLIRALPTPQTIEDDRFRSAAGELFERVLQVADNAGTLDEHRALNYLAVRYPQIYSKCAEAHAEGAGLASIETKISRLSGVRKIVDVVFIYRHRSTDVTEKYFVRVDITEQFPFLVTKLSPYYDR